MKKISLFFACLIASIAFISCEEDPEPRVKAPATNDFLNIPPTAENFVYDLENCGAINLTCSQPDYGVAVIPTYAVQVSLSEDFATLPSAEWIYDETVAVPYVELPFSSTQADMEVPAIDVAQAISTILGYKKIDEYAGRTPYSGDIYVRLRSYFPTLGEDSYTNVISNVIKLKVESFATVRVPGVIYLVGVPAGNWTEPSSSNADLFENWKLSETEDGIGSKIYHGTFYIESGQFTFRFYTALTGWENDSFGAKGPDEDEAITLTDGVYEGIIMKGKGKYAYAGWPGGWLQITVDLKEYKVTFVEVDGPNQ